jgi:hypothetical protein
VHIRDSCCGAAACTFTLCCGISCPYFDRMVYQVQSQDTIHITSQYSFGFSHYSWSTLSIMQTGRHSLIAQVSLKKYFICVTSSECLKSLEYISHIWHYVYALFYRDLIHDHVRREEQIIAARKFVKLLMPSERIIHNLAEQNLMSTCPDYSPSAVAALTILNYGKPVIHDD